MGLNFSNAYYSSLQNQPTQQQLQGNFSEPLNAGIAAAGTGDTDTLWNRGWNIGFNNPNTGYGGQDVNERAGYLIGQQEYWKRNPAKVASDDITNTNNTGGTTQTTQPPNNTGIPAVDMSFYQGWNDQNAINADWANTYQQKLGQTSGGQTVDPYAGLRDEISSGYDTYTNQLNEMMNVGLPGQKSGMEQIIGNQYTSGIGDLNTQQAQGLSDLGAERTSATQNQNKNLKDIADNIRNMFMSGNVYLGSRGAGDSSAGNQYSYALTKVGNKARGDVMSQTSNIQAEIGRRETNLKQVVGNEIQKLGQERDNKIIEVSNWFNEQQNAIRDRIGQVGLSKSTDLTNLKRSLLDAALQKLQYVESDTRERRSMLEEWAMNQSKSIGELKQNMASIASYAPQLPQASRFSGTPSISGGNYNMPINWSTNTQDREKDIFGNIIR